MSSRAQAANHPREAAGFRPRAPLPAPPFLVLGLGRAGQSAVRTLTEIFGPDAVRAWDADTGRTMQRLRRELEARGITTHLGPRLTRREVGFARTVIKSPGIPYSIQAIDRARGKGREVLDELELGWRLTEVPVLGVTGTNGKSTVCGLAHAVLAGAGQDVQLAGNTEFGEPLTSAARRPSDWIVCEVSSFQLEGCVSVLPELAVFTNLTPEHLGRHHTIGEYGAVKQRLFINGTACVSRAVIDIDTPFGQRLAARVERRGGMVHRVGTSRGADYRIRSTRWDLRASRTVIETPNGLTMIGSPLPGLYNARNLAAGLALADLLGLDRRTALAALGGYPGTPGRFEHVDVGQPFDVIVDFAHTPDAMEQLLTTIRAGMRSDGRLIVVFGLGGVPGTLMRRMGQITAQLSDHLVLTTSGFRGIPPLPTLASILGGARSARSEMVEPVLNRRRAIERGIAVARAGDVVVIPGRGALPSVRSDPRGESHPFDDRAVAREAIRALSRMTELPSPSR